MTQAQPNFSQEMLDRLQRLRISVIAFQNKIAPLPAGQQNDTLNELFNQLRLEAKAMLKTQGFDKRVPQAITKELVSERSQKSMIPRISAIVIFGVILALLGLGINSVILEDVIINSLGCLISTVGMLLIFSAFAVVGISNLGERRHITNLGDLYQRSDALLYEINHALNMAIPGIADRPPVSVPEIPSTVELALDSLGKQATDWQQKLRMLEEQRLSLGPDAPLELTVNIDFVKREMERVGKAMDRLRGRELPAATEKENLASADSIETAVP